jgi:hypothetical protein
MGTSISHRSPETARWRAVQAAYAEGLTDSRVALEILRAAEDWRPALRSEAIAHYVEALEVAHASFADRLRATRLAPEAVQAVVEEVRKAALASRGDISGVALAERALQRTLVDAARSQRPLVDTDGPEAATAWTRNRGTAPAELVGRFVGELFRQFTRHVVARDLAALVGHPRFKDVTEAHNYRSRLAEHIADQASEAYELSYRRQPQGAWQRAVDEVFAPASPPANA